MNFLGSLAESEINSLFMLFFLREQMPGCLPRPYSIYYLLRVKSALLSPETVTGLDWLFAPSCQAVTV